MKTKKITQLLKKNTYLTSLKNNQKVKLILNIGSIPRGDFIEGWSDIDLLIVVESINLQLFKTIYEYQNFLEKKSKIKIGIEIILTDHLQKMTKGKKWAVSSLKILKQFHPNNRQNFKRGILYQNNKFKLTMPPKKFFENLDLKEYLISAKSAIVKILGTYNIKDNKKYILRKLIKNSLLVMQTKLLVDSGELTDNFDLVLRKYKNKYSFDINVIQKSFKKRFLWKTISNKEISLLEIEENWNFFQLLVNNTTNTAK